MSALFALVASSCRFQSVPLPAETPAQVIVSGRSSTLKSIQVQSVGSNIPATYSGDRLHNADGFEWWVSQHYALQTDYKPERAKHLLTLLELAYPHYVALFGREPKGIESKRMAVVYGSSKDSLNKVLISDGIQWNFAGGGITYEGINAAYNYPSGSLQYHQRYIMLHECVHLMQDCLFGSTRSTPGWYYEGIADSVSHHVWEADKQRLTLSCFDKPTINNWLDAADEEYAKNPFKASDIISERRGGRPLGFILVNYFNSDISRAMKFQIWRDELIRLNKRGATKPDSERLMKELFGSTLDADFDDWIKQHPSTFHYVDWGWEQDGDSMMSYGFPQSGPFSQTNINISLGSADHLNSLAADYPSKVRSKLVGSVHLGDPNAVVGCLVSFKQNPRVGMAGLGLGVEGRSLLSVVVDQQQKISIDASGLGGPSQVVPLSPAFVEASAGTNEIGLTLKIGTDELLVSARTGSDASAQVANVKFPLTSSQRARILKDPIAVLSKGGLHWVTPYYSALSDSQDWPDTAAPANRWKLSHMRELYALARAAWRLGDDAPQSLKQLELKIEANQLLASELDKSLAEVRSDVEKGHGAPDSIELALKEIDQLQAKVQPKSKGPERSTD